VIAISVADEGENMKQLFAFLILSIGLSHQSFACGGGGSNNTVADFAKAYSNYLNVRANENGGIDVYAKYRCMFQYRIESANGREDKITCIDNITDAQQACADGKNTEACVKAVASCLHTCPEEGFFDKDKVHPQDIEFYKERLEMCNQIRESVNAKAKK
jgi:hypothetical protein